ncbi:hypothetical protein HKX69_29945 [Streptomyces argyrophyllae]|uniref:Uncharacterized protein n=1 Tax=Streptomyces argyrophylli TaxID=2726118 RepID=A0A6M4PQG2_9ACTN|nr:hypothetical protein [Streptomyces argyrophyllae]QJS13201.1 hypothetical protein HKX69_29945 [Streptomyces argyrophyllae]
MAATPHDPHNLRELAATVVLGVRIDRRRARGKSTKALENRVDRIREEAQQREDQRGKGRKQQGK